MSFTGFGSPKRCGVIVWSCIECGCWSEKNEEDKTEGNW
jgi:hypothetical protein